MHCPHCGARANRIRVHDEANPFSYLECVECGWDDYELQALNLQDDDSDDVPELNLDGDEDELEEDC